MFMTRIKWAFAVAFLSVVSTDLSAAWQELPTGEVQEKAQALAEHALEIRPVFTSGEPQEFRLGSICVAGRNAAWVSRIDKAVP